MRSSQKPSSDHPLKHAFPHYELCSTLREADTPACSPGMPIHLLQGTVPWKRFRKEYKKIMNVIIYGQIQIDQHFTYITLGKEVTTHVFYL